MKICCKEIRKNGKSQRTNARVWQHFPATAPSPPHTHAFLANPSALCKD